MAKKLTKETGTKSAWGKEIPEVKYSFDWTEYETNEEVDAAQAWLSKDKQRKVLNAQAQNKARQAAQNAALVAAGYVKPNLENDEQLRLREFVKVIMSGKKHTEEAARELASATLGIAWVDDDDE